MLQYTPVSIPQVGLMTPWGIAQSVEQITPEIYSVDTPSHGGLFVIGETYEAIPQPWRDYACKFSHGWGEHWFEEDCAVVAVILTHPSQFDPKTVEVVRETVDKYLPQLTVADLRVGMTVTSIGTTVFDNPQLIEALDVSGGKIAVTRKRLSDGLVKQSYHYESSPIVF